MIRIFFHYVLPLVLPAAVYFAWAWMARRKAAAGGAVTPADAVPWLWLIVAGFVLMAAALVTWGVASGEDPEGTYQAPRYEDGKIIPGGTVPREAQ